jgi:plastocyanin
MMRATILLSLVFAVGCSDSTQNDLGASKDMAMQVPDDLSRPTDTAVAGDMAVPPDMARIFDLAGTTVVMVAPNGSLTFDPTTVTIQAGDTVAWVWASSGHSVVSGTVLPETPDHKFCSPTDTGCAAPPSGNAGDVYTHTFTTAGSYPYYCFPHGDVGMTGTITVM